jgi:hypothetical protein
MPKLYPTGQGFVNGWPMAEIEVDKATADELLAYTPPVYSLKPTGWPPAAPPEAPENPGLPDSTPEE